MPIQSVLLGRHRKAPGVDAAEYGVDAHWLCAIHLSKSYCVAHITHTTIQTVLAGDRCSGARLGTKSRLLGA